MSANNYSIMNSNYFLYITMVGFLTLLVSGPAIVNEVKAQQDGTEVNNNFDTSPNIDAESVFNTKTMTLGSNINNLVVLIPDEGHHGPGESDESRFLDQHFVPDNAVVSPGTTVTWFNGDVGHVHIIDVKNTDSSSSLLNTGEITDLQGSNTYTFNKTGTFNYEAEGDDGVTMTGTIQVSDNLPPLDSNSTETGSIDTVGIIMVPTQDKDSDLKDLTDSGLTIQSTYDFKDLRGGQKGTRDVQTLVVWSSAGKDLKQDISAISDLSSSLPYS